MTVSPNRTMLPPIWVAACDSQRRRNAAVAEDRERRRVGRLGGSPVVGVTRRPSRAGSASATAAVSAGSPRLDEPDEAALERAPLEQDVAAAASGSAGRCRRRADRPARCRRRTGAARRRRTTSPRSSGRTGWSGIGGSGYQRRGWPWVGTRVRVGGRQLEPVDRRDRDRDVGLRGGELGDDAARRGSASPVSLSGAPMASSSNGSPSGVSVDRSRARRRRSRPTPVTTRTSSIGDRLGAGVAQLVDQLLDPVPVDRAADRDRDARAR